MRKYVGIVLLPWLLGYSAWGQSICEPNAQTLPAGNGEELIITESYKVPAGDYRYGNVHIINGGRLCFEDEAIDFWASAILIENTGSLIAGQPEQPIGTNPGGQLTIHLYGKDQGPNGRGVACKTDTFCGVPETIWNAGDGQKVSLPGGAEDDYFYPYTPMMFDNADANAYFGYKVLGVAYGGSLQLFGKKGASYGALDEASSGTSWVRLAQTLRPNTELSNRIVLNRPVDWQEQDQIVVTTTDYLPGHSEQFTIQSVSADKKTLTVEESAQYMHNGKPYLLADTPSRKKGYDRLGLDITVDGDPAAETRAAVGLLTRSIRIVSAGDELGEDFPPESQFFPSTEQPGEQHPYYFGGHLVIRQGVAQAQIQGVEFYQLGQGGRMGHYPIHFHMTRKAPPDTFVKDSTIHDSMTRWIVLHGVQNVLLARNVGYKSIGHGYYLEDGSEINNQLYANLGVLARAAVDNPHNPRKVPGILAWTENKAATDIVPSHSDYAHPTVFWLMNTWNDVDHNMAAGATACGACYWPLPGILSGPSAKQKWDSYASLQTFPDRAGATPLKSFSGNYCSTAMNSFNSTANVSVCNGLGAPAHDAHLEPISNPLAPRPGGWTQDNYYPRVDPGGQRFATRCDASSIGATVDPVRGDVDCKNVPRCSASNPDGCRVNVLDRYTTSFHWTETNFSAIWLRPQWFLVQNSVISDVQNAGLTFVTGGDYTKSSSIDGNWLLARKNVFIGHTQAQSESANPLAADWGPFNKDGLACDNANSTVNYCVSIAEGITLPLSNWANNQRLFNIYDGPAQQDSNAYLDITRRPVDDCSDAGNGGSGNCQDSQSMYGRVLGMPFNKDEQQCYLPNAAIAWKQPNGFYYPPSFHSKNLYFDNVDIRHFVIEPLFEPGTRRTDEQTVRENYCTFNAMGSFEGYTSIDRQTVLNDDDGSLTGLVNTISVNEDPFFNAPVEAVECASEGTAKTSPYQYVTTAIYPGCAVRGDCGENGKIKTGQPPVDWGKSCTNGDCYGVPLYRQYLTAQEKIDKATPTIRLMGQAIWQRSNLTPNHGVFYIDTTVSRERQEQELPPPPVEPEAVHPQQLNVFKNNETYYVYLVFATPQTRQTYQIYMGEDFDPESLRAVTTPLAGSKLSFADVDWPSSWDIEVLENGVWSITLDMDFDLFEQAHKQAKLNSCQPKSFCQLNEQQQCVSVAGDKELDAACAWAGVDVDCPEGGCYGFAFTLPDSFNTLSLSSNPRPQADDFPSDDNWDIAWRHANPDLAGDCFDPPTKTTQFSDLQTTPLFNTKIIYGSDRSESIQGSTGNDIILGLQGDDVIDGLGGDDWISGGAGNDLLNGAAGNDFLHGDEGNDDVMGGAGDDSLDGGEGNDILLGEAGDDVLTGGPGNDFLYGGEGGDLINGDEGEDTCATIHGPSSCEQAF